MGDGAVFRFPKSRKGLRILARMTMVWTIVAIVAVVAFALLVIPLVLRSVQSPADLRANGRVPLEIPVRLRLGERQYDTVSADISREGIGLKTEARATAGHPAEVEFALPGQPRVLIYAVVRWASAGRLGLWFDVQDKKRRVVAAWLDAQPAATVEP
jgi:hypothetical protein